MAGIGDIFKGAGSSAEQLFLWGIASAVVAALGTPYFQAVQQFSFENDPNTPLSPETLAVLVIKRLVESGEAETIAKKSGLAPEQFRRLVEVAQDAIPASALAEALRRRFIPAAGEGAESVSFEQGLREARIAPKWHPVIRKLAVADPTPSDALDALLEGQISHERAAELFAEFGGNPDYFDMMFHTRGQAPTPTQALELLNRGVIPERGTGPDSISYEQAFLEGPWRNKWLEPFIELRRYFPPARTVTAMFHDGQLTHDQAAHYLAAQGLDQTLIEAYLKPTHSTKASTDRTLTKTEILAMYEDKLIDKAEATHALVALHYSEHDAQQIVTLTDLRLETAQVRAGTTRARSLYQSGKITGAQAEDILTQLGIKPAQAHEAVQTWSITQSHDTKVLTSAEVVAAWYYRVIDSPSAMHLLQRAGFDEFDAWVMLSVRNHGPLDEIPRPSSPYPPPPPIVPTV